MNFNLRFSQELTDIGGNLKNDEVVIPDNVEENNNAMWSSSKVIPRRDASYLLMFKTGSPTQLYLGIVLATTSLSIFIAPKEGMNK